VLYKPLFISEKSAVRWTSLNKMTEWRDEWVSE
jgi:hypothetical protein